MSQLIEQKKPATLGSFLATQKKQIEAALPKHLTADRMLRIVMTELRKIPQLKECTPQSIIGSVIQCSQLGLEPGGSLGHAYLIPYDVNKNTGTKQRPIWKKEKECQFQLGYRGMIELARRSGKIRSISAHVVYSNDLFEFEYGLTEKLRHVPAKGHRGEFECAYAIAMIDGGGHQFEVMQKHEIDSIKSRSKSANSAYTPWATDYDEMARKTVVRRLFKYLPVSIEIRDAISLDDAAETGQQYNTAIFEGEWEVAEAENIEVGVNKSAKEDALEKALDQAPNNEFPANPNQEDAEAIAKDFFKD